MSADLHSVVIIGGGFAGLYAARRLGRAPVDVTLIDRRNHHLFQPLLYQVATGGLSPGDIASPLRAVLKRKRNVRVWQAEAIDLDLDKRTIVLRDGVMNYDTLVVATGVSHAYFGNDTWADHAPGLKTIEDALDIRRRIFLAFETAEREPDPDRRREWMTFAIVGAGPTGVELAGALAELARGTLKRDFRTIDPTEARIVLIDSMHRVLPPYPPELSAEAQRALAKKGVEVRTQCRVTDVEADGLVLEHGDRKERIDARTILWAAGVEASPLGRLIAGAAGVEPDKAGRVIVEPDLTVPGHPEVFVIGDLAAFNHQGGEPLPGNAPVAMQQGRFVADAIVNRLSGRPVGRFHYHNKGSLAVIGRNAAVADMPRFRFSGYLAWLTWGLVHIFYLIEFDSKLLVMIQWVFNYFTRKRGARLITGDDPQPLIRREEAER